MAFDFVQAPDTLDRDVNEPKFGRVCVQSYQTNGSCLPKVTITDEQIKVCPQLAAVWTCCLMVDGGAPRIQFPNSPWPGRDIFALLPLQPCMTAGEFPQRGSYVVFKSSLTHVLADESDPQKPPENGRLSLSFPLVAVVFLNHWSLL